METFYVDTNIFLRFVLKDVDKQVKIVEKKFLLAKMREIKVVCASEVIPEIIYVLDKGYGFSREDISDYINVIIKTPYFDIEQRELWVETMRVYPKVNIDIVDIFLAVKANHENAKVFSFDKDFKKLKKHL